MGAAVRVESSVWGDLRYDHLAAMLGVSKYEVIGRMTHLWGFCTERLAHALAPAAVDVIIDHQKLIEADLAEMQPDGLVRVKGTKGRIEWLEKKRKAASKGGKSRGKQLRVTRQASALAPAKVMADPATTPPAPALTTTRYVDTKTRSRGSRVTLEQAEAAYDLYPRKQGKADGIAKLRERISGPEDYDACIAWLKRLAKAWEGSTKEQRRYLPHFKTWANQRRWDDEEIPEPEPEKPLAKSVAWDAYTGPSYERLS